jgi:hypothetical protein
LHTATADLEAAGAAALHVAELGLEQAGATSIAIFLTRSWSALASFEVGTGVGTG